MDAPVEKAAPAWQPLTPRGIAAFAGASLGRLLTVQFVFALLGAVSMVWFLHSDWYPVITEGLRKLPADGELRAGHLDWRGDSPVRLAEGRFLALVVDLKHSGQARSLAHITIELGERDCRFFSLLGFMTWKYPGTAVVEFNRPQSVPWWGAWSAPLLGIAAAVVIVMLFFFWALLASIYCLPASLAGFFTDRDLTLGGGWRLAGAALMPGAVFFSGAIWLYGLGVLDVVLLGVAFGSHLLVGWFYLVAGLAALPRHPATLGTRGNPFQRVKD